MKTRLILIIVITALLLANSAAMPQLSRAATNSSMDEPQTPEDTYLTYLAITLRNYPPSPGSNRIVVDHNSIALFERIPDQYIHAASQLHQLFRHASVGWNIDGGLDCLMNKPQPRPPSCDRGVPINEIIFDSKYNRDNWDFEFHLPPPAQNPGWYEKINLFINRADILGMNSPYQVYSYKFGYVDGFEGSYIDDEFFTSNNPTYATIEDLEALEDRYPNKIFVYWTMGLARIVGTSDSTRFNQQMRAYTQQHNKVLMDIADITSHRLDGTPCFDRNGNGYEAMCDEYTDEENAGHLNGLGSQRMAKAIWVLMARLAGWNP